MKRLFIFIFFCGLFGISTLASNAQGAESLRFYYLMSDSYTIPGPMVQSLRNVYEDVFYDKCSAIFYMPNMGSDARIVKLNMPGDNRIEFESMINTLVNSNHQPNEAKDIYTIIDLFSKNDFLLPSGEMRYQYIQLAFYVSPSFSPESSFIPQVVFSLGLDQLPEDKVQVLVYRAKNNTHENDESITLSDPWNICRNLSVHTY